MGNSQVPWPVSYPSEDDLFHLSLVEDHCWWICTNTCSTCCHASHSSKVTGFCQHFDSFLLVRKEETVKFQDVRDRANSVPLWDSGVCFLWCSCFYSVSCFHKLITLQRWTHAALKACSTSEEVWCIRASQLILHSLKGGEERYTYSFSLYTFSISDLCVFHCQTSITCGDGYGIMLP